jgi:hypothetical protein
MEWMDFVIVITNSHTVNMLNATELFAFKCSFCATYFCHDHLVSPGQLNREMIHFSTNNVGTTAHSHTKHEV